MIKLISPLRYPGGKQRYAAAIASRFPQGIENFVEPFVGGGSVFLYAKSNFSELRTIWINDLYPEVYFFWNEVANNAAGLAQVICQIKSKFSDGRSLYAHLTEGELSYLEKLTPEYRAARFFLLNRITFSGISEAGGYSESAFLGRLTPSAIARVKNLHEQLRSVYVTNHDYAKLTHLYHYPNTFIFCDPPYLSKSKSKLYGKHGKLHLDFDHDRFASVMKTCPHQWLITYDDCPQVRQNFKFANIQSWDLRYGMNNVGVSKQRSPGKELIITNY